MINYNVNKPQSINSNKKIPDNLKLKKKDR